MNILKQITSIITNATNEESPIRKAAAQIAAIAEQESDKEATIKAIAELALDIRDQDKGNKERTPESDERAYAFHLCYALIGLYRYKAREGFSYIAYPAGWPGKPAFKLGDFLKDMGTVEGIARDGAVWFYFLRGRGWFRESDLQEREPEQEPEPTATSKLSNQPFNKPDNDDYDPFLDLD